MVWHNSITSGYGGTRTLELRYSAGAGDATASVSMNSAPASTLTLKRTADWNTFGIVTMPITVEYLLPNTLISCEASGSLALDAIGLQ